MREGTPAFLLHQCWLDFLGPWGPGALSSSTSPSPSRTEEGLGGEATAGLRALRLTVQGWEEWADSAFAKALGRRTEHSSESIQLLSYFLLCSSTQHAPPALT